MTACTTCCQQSQTGLNSCEVWASFPEVWGAGIWDAWIWEAGESLIWGSAMRVEVASSVLVPSGSFSAF